MPLVRFQVRNEYSLGHPELYKEVDREDPEAILDGVAVAGLVGILRQLGDLAEFAADVFHGLQEQVMTTASRSHRLMARVQAIEAALPPLEKSVLAQSSHIHFAYTSGSEWHPHTKICRNHFVYNDLPQVIMDSYEECRDPPRLQLLDKYDIGGPGSCLKRYSDPTIFRRASASSDEASIEKVQKDKRTRRNKKKRSLWRNRDVFLRKPISAMSGRMQFVSPTGSGQSHSQTASTADMTMKSDLGEHSNSFDSRAGAGYIECVFRPSNSMQPDQEESKESSSCSLTQQNDTLHSDFPAIDDELPHISQEKKIAFSSSHDTWDVKEEIVNQNDQQCDGDEVPEMCNPKGFLKSDEEKSANLANANCLKIPSSVENTPSQLEIDEVESEPDNYMDALNTIESESENDLDWETKGEVQKISIVERGIVEDRTIEIPPSTLDHHSSSSDSRAATNVSLYKETDRELLESVHELPPHVPDHHLASSESCAASNVPFNEPLPGKSLDSPASESYFLEQTPNMHGTSILEQPSCSFGDADRVDGSELQSLNTEATSPSSEIPDLQNASRDKINSNASERKVSNAEFSCNHSVNFWTNGGLLGLEPSKPSESTMSASAMKNETTNPSGQDFMVKSNGNKDKPVLAESGPQVQKNSSSRCFTSGHGNQENCTLDTNFSSGALSAHMDARNENLGASNHVNGFSQISRNDTNKIKIMAPHSALPVAPEAKTISTEPCLGSNEDSSRVFSIGHRLFLNGFHRRASLDENSWPVGSVKTCVWNKEEQESKAYREVQEAASKEQLNYAYFIDSHPSSPPLEHMKISFHPINNLEASKLKLKFPGDGYSRENLRDTLPSFHLVPEPHNSLHDSGSCSDDDDTFCRSSPYMSDDCFGNDSDYNSEQWECGKSPEHRDEDGSDSFQRISLTKSISSSQDPRGETNTGMSVDPGPSGYIENDKETSFSRHLLDFPSFDSINPVHKQECRENYDTDNILKLQSPGEPVPPPPPLPPTEWRVLKPQLDSTADKPNCVSDDIDDTFDQELPEYTLSRPGPVKQNETNSEVHDQNELKQKNKDEMKLNRQTLVDEVGNGNGIDEREDFLQQIRTKSFNLRRTATAKPNIPTGLVTGTKINAILEKANAIRQVVASDYGEDDDNWSDP